MSINNEMRLDFPALPENESFARMVISGFMLSLNPTLEQLADVKTEEGYIVKSYEGGADLIGKGAAGAFYAAVTFVPPKRLQHVSPIEFDVVVSQPPSPPGPLWLHKRGELYSQQVVTYPCP